MIYDATIPCSVAVYFDATRTQCHYSKTDLKEKIKPDEAYTHPDCMFKPALLSVIIKADDALNHKVQAT